MKQTLLSRMIIIPLSCASCYAVTLLVFGFLTSQHARTAANTTFDAIIGVSHLIVICAVCGCILLPVSAVGFLVWKAIQKYDEHDHQRVLTRKVRVETFVQENLLTASEGTLALTGPGLQSYDRTLVPRAPKVERIVEETTLALPEHLVPDAFTCEGIAAFDNPHIFYWGKHARGETITKIEDTYHIIDSSASGKGKTVRFMLIMAQAVRKGCVAYFINPFANPVKPVNDARQIEVWKPIFDRLAEPPKKTADEIKDLCERLLAQIDRRKVRESQGDFSFKKQDLYVFIDETPEVYALYPGIKHFLDRVGRTGRQYHVFLYVAAQDIYVGTIAQGKGSQAQYRTRMYGGGDLTSANNSVGKGIVTLSIEKAIKENKGLYMIVADGLDELLLTRAPLPTNEWLFDYLDCGPFVLEEWLTPQEQFQLQSERSQEPFWTSSVDIEMQPSHSLGFTGYKSFSTGQVEKVETNLKSQDTRKRPLSDKEKDRVFTAIVKMEHEGTDKLTTHAVCVRAGLDWNTYKLVEAFALSKGRTLHRTVRTDGTDTVS